ncbi:MAG: hypothetical protein K9J27_05345 [Bacteroidales bacterium]|nr:hypothetical protein [Bacteroidales bacterium]MCF8333833.1 hypothetical protein [Bacteroidales bacterium]
MNRKLLFIILLAIFSLFLATNAFSQENMVLRGDSLLEVKRFEKAIDSYRQALKADSGNKSLSEKINKAKRLKKEALESYQNAISQGQQFLQRKEYKKAVEAFQTALDNRPEASYPKMKLDEIRQHYEVPGEQTEYERYVEKADSLMENYKYEQALTFYNKALEIKPRQVKLLKKTQKVKKFIEKQKQRSKSYDQTIARAQQLFDNEQYEQAMTKYQEASLIKPDKEQPDNKIDQIRGLIKERERKNQAYQATIDKADSLYMDKRFEQAKTVYQKAMEIKPSENYPVNMINKIDPALAEKQKTNQRYTQLIEQADRAFKAEEFEKAVNLYTQAEEIDSSREYPQNQIEKINRLVNQQEKRYDSLITSADSLREQNKLSLALGGYKKANEIKPREEYPQNQIQKINNTLESLEKKQERYNNLIAEADSLAENNRLAPAIASYEAALELYPDKKYPSQQISALEGQRKKRQEKQTRYENLITEGDSLLEQKQLGEAEEAYEKALALYSGKSYPKEQLDRIADKREKLKNKKAAYQSLIAAGDSLFENQTFAKAKANYKEALHIFPDKNYPEKMISSVDSAIRAREEKQARYDSLIAEADNFTEKEKYNEALSAYQDAEKLFSEKPYPSEKIAEINDTLDKLENRENAYNTAINMADSLYNQEKYEKAITYYGKALEYFKDRTYPGDRIAKCRDIISNIKARNNMYREIIAKADSLLAAEEYKKAGENYRNALGVKPGDAYANRKILQIENTLNNIEQNYNKALAKGNTQFDEENYEKALAHYKKASQLKPEEQKPKDKIRETQQILDKLHKQMMEKYNQIIADADQKYENKKYSDAIAAYERAAELNEEADYPKKMIQRIKKYLKEHSMREVITQSTSINKGSEKKFTFQPLGYNDRNDNFIVIQAKGSGKRAPKLFLNYGKEDTKNGGVVIPSITTSQSRQYIINLSDHRKWYDNENNWISIYVQDGGLQIQKMSIVKGD